MMSVLRWLAERWGQILCFGFGFFLSLSFEEYGVGASVAGAGFLLTGAALRATRIFRKRN